MKDFKITIEFAIDRREHVDTVHAKSADDAFNKWAASKKSTQHGFRNGGRKGRDTHFTGTFDGANSRVYSRRIYVTEIKDQQ